MAHNIRYAKRINKNKLLINIGDIAISKTHGIGTVTAVELDDCLLPILVQFSKCNCQSHQHLLGYTAWYDCNGESNSPENWVKFYKHLDLTNKDK